MSVEKMNIILPERKIPVCSEYDLLVCGGGLSGIAAAVNAAREGLKVGLIEYFGKLGGTPVSGLLGMVSGFAAGEDRIVSAFVELLKARCGVGNGAADYGFKIVFDPEKLNRVLMELLAEHRVEVRFYTQLIDAVRNGEDLQYAVVASKSGISALKAGIFVDDTGDGDLAVRAGCRYEIGRDGDGRVQSSTLVFHVGGIDASRAPRTYPELNAIWKSDPEIQTRVPINHMVVGYLPDHDGLTDGIVNMTHIVDCDPLDFHDQTRIRSEGTRQAYEILEFMRRRLPGYERAYLVSTAAQLGVRESRRIFGDYLLTAADVLSGRDFPDEIARCYWGIDIHNPTGSHGGIGSRRPAQSYGVPYRCVTPCGLRNLYIAGRPISATHEAFASCRINGTCVTLGEAIGLAAPAALNAGSTRAADVSSVQTKLEQMGSTVRRGTPR